MKKVFALLAAVALLATTSMAQQSARRLTEKDVASMSPAALFKAQQQSVATITNSPKTAGDTVSTFPYTQGFETGTAPAGFTFVDGDNDGYNWDPTFLYGEGSGHDGSNGLIASASYVNNVGALTPNNWMVLPSFEIPSDATGFNLTWYEKGQDASYAAEYYSVYISTTGRTPADFTATTAVLSSTTTGNWVKKTVDLSNYGGQTINIAFRHYNVTDMYYLDIDDIRVGGPEAPQLSIAGPAIVLMNNAATFTATTDVATLTWYVDGVAESATGLTMTTTFTTDGLHEVVAEATNSVGTTADTINVTVVDCGAGINTFPHVENFEAANPCWLFVSADPANDDRTGIVNTEAFQGTSSFVFSSYASAPSGDYNQFLISPEITLPTGGTTYMVKFWYKGHNASDAFRVLVSTTTSDTAAFTTVLGDNATVATDWTEVAYLLPAATKYIAINYYGNYAYYLYVDSLLIDELTAPSVSLAGPETVGTGIVATFTATTNLANSLVWYVDGVDVNNAGNVLTTTFTTVGTHEVVVEAINTVGSNYDTIEVDVFSCDDITAPYAPDFSTILGCWVNRSDSTESGWFLSADMMETPMGQVLSMSAQSVMGIYMMDIPTDNWLTSPIVTLPAGNNYEVAWKVRPFSPNYPGDHYGVYLVDGEQTTLLFEESLNENMTDFVQRTVAIPAGMSSARIAFRHFNSVGGYVIILDDIQIRTLSAPIVTIEGPASIAVNAEATFTAVSGSADSFAWTVDGNAVSSTTATLNYTFTDAGNHTVAVTATNAAGSNSASMTVNVYSCDVAFPYNEDFEGSTANCWQLTERFAVYEHSNYSNSGTHFLLGSYDDYADVDEWAISPAITLPNDVSGLGMTWYVRLNPYQGIVNSYEVRVSTTGSEISDFGTVLFSETDSTDGYVQRSTMLTAYAGQTIRIAFHNVSPMGGDAMMIDDVAISGGVVGINGVNEANVTIFPNPVSSMLRVEGEGIQQVEIIDVNGRMVMTAKAGNINVSNLADGVYMVRVVTENGVSTQKIVKK